jgi:hypothetical protein
VSFLIRNPKATITDDEAGKVQETVIEVWEKNGYPLRSKA